MSYGSYDQEKSARDNHSISAKVYLRRLATKGMRSLRVLDAFAGTGELWSHFDKDDYLAIEVNAKKNRTAINEDNRKVIPRLDLSRFNVIDLDSYGCPATQIRLLYDNGSMQDGTVIVYTSISNAVSEMPIALREHAGIPKEFYEKCQTQLCKHTPELFDSFLASLGVSRVFEYCGSHDKGYVKRYGYFTVRK